MLLEESGNVRIAHAASDLGKSTALAGLRGRDPRSRAETHHHHQHLPELSGPLAEPALIAACGGAPGR